MKITFSSVSFKVEGIGMKPPFTYFSAYLSEYLQAKTFSSTIEYILFIFAYPTPIPFRNKNIEKEEYMDWYSKLPLWRTANKRTTATMTIPFPEFLKYLSGRYNEEEMLEVLTVKLIEMFEVIGQKLRKGDVLEHKKIIEYIEEIRRNTTKEDLWEIERRYEAKNKAHTITLNREDREKPKNIEGANKVFIRDIKLYDHFDNINAKLFSPYDAIICSKIVDLLKPYKFKCPGFTHIYISVSDSFDNALYHTTRAEKWFAYGVATLENPAEYAKKTVMEKKKIVFDLIKTGILDIAVPSKLDLDVLQQVLNEVEETYVNKLPEQKPKKRWFS